MQGWFKASGFGNFTNVNDQGGWQSSKSRSANRHIEACTHADMQTCAHAHARTRRRAHISFRIVQ